MENDRRTSDGSEFDVKKRDGVNDWRKCPIHKAWKRKGQCEQCLMERDARRREYERMGGSNKPPVKTRKL